MNGKLLIVLFMLVTLPAFADDSPFRDEVINELPPQLPVQNNSVQANKPKLTKKFPKVFHKSSDGRIKKAKEIEIAEPEKTVESVQNKTKKQAKKRRKGKQSDVKNSSNIKELNNMVDEAQKNYGEIPAVNSQNTDNSVLTDIAYKGSVDTTRIIEVNNCVKIALENHPLIRYAMSNAEIYKSKIAQAWSNYFPTFSAGISYSRNNMQMSNFVFPIQEYDMFYVPNASGNLLLFDFGKTKTQADIAKRSYEAAKYSLQNSINNVVYSVKQSYYNLLFAQQQVKVYEDTVNDYKLHLEQAKAYYNIGTKPKIDVLTAEYNLGNAKLNLIQAKNTLKTAYIQLSNSMGMPEYKDYEVTDNLTHKVYDIDIEQAVKTAFETSPELLAAKKKADASELLVRSSKRAFTPDISGFAGYTRGGKKVDTDYGYQFGAQLNYSTVNLMLLKKQVDEAKAAYKRDLADYENIKQNIYYQVKEAYINLVNAQESIGVAKLSMDRAKEQYEQASGRYKVGLGEAIELKDAETTYRNSQLNYYNTLLNYHVSAANLEKIMGIPLEASDVDLL